MSSIASSLTWLGTNPNHQNGEDARKGYPYK
jgi:hypothetical protein